MEEHLVETQEQDTLHQEEQVQEEQPVQQAAAPQENPGLKSIRLEKERLARENQELMNRLKRIEEQQQAQHDPDDLVPRKYVDERLRKVEQQMHQASMEYKLKVNYPDYDKVVNDATIAQLKEKSPALASAIGQVSDIYSQASAAYDAIRNLGLYTEDTYSRDRERAQNNAQKPKSLQSISSQNTGAPGTPLSKVNAFADGLTDDYKKQLWQEMNAYRKQTLD